MVSFEPRVQKHREVLFSSAQCQAEIQVLPAPALTLLDLQGGWFVVGMTSR